MVIIMTRQFWCFAFSSFLSLSFNFLSLTLLCLVDVVIHYDLISALIYSFYFLFFRHEKQIRYPSRKANADVRKRVKGRFVKREGYDSDSVDVARSYWEFVVRHLYVEMLVVLLVVQKWYRRTQMVVSCLYMWFEFDHFLCSGPFLSIALYFCDFGLNRPYWWRWVLNIIEGYHQCGLGKNNCLN